jgi:hypothetical protein
MERRQDRSAGSPGPSILRDEDASADWSVSAGAEATVGYDTNPAAGADAEQFQAPTGQPGQDRPDGPGVPGPPDMNGDGEAAAPSAYSHLGARMVAEVGRRLWARARLGADFRQYFDGNRRAQEWLAVEGGWRSETWLTRLTVEASRYDDTMIPDDAWTVRSNLGLSRWLGERGLLGVHADTGARYYDLQDTRDGFVGGGVFGGVQGSRLRLAVGFDAQRRWSTLEIVNRTELMPWAAAGYQWDWLDVDARYETHVRFFDQGNLDGREHRVRVRAALRPWRPPVALVASVAHGRARGNPQALSYDRWDVSIGVAAQLDRRAESPLPSEAVSARQGPATVSEHGVRFRVHRPGAKDVAVMGTFNGWDPEAGRLAPSGDGWFESHFDLPSGRHQYQLLVDGEPVTPDDAPGYLPDDFGGRNAIVVVP